MKTMLGRLLALALLALLFASPLAIAKSDLMKVAANQSPTPEPGKAMVVFLRPSRMGFAVESTVYDAPDAETKFLGIVSYKTRVAYQVDPGPHRFMVIGENADFVDATLDAGKTYYILVRVRMGMWKARFSLLPVHLADAKYTTQSAEFKEWMENTGFVETTPAALDWYAQHKADVQAKKAEYLQKWNVMLPQDRASLTIHAEDGTTEPTPQGHPPG
jgi:hypothetical protein